MFLGRRCSRAPCVYTLTRSCRQNIQSHADGRTLVEQQQPRCHATFQPIGDLSRRWKFTAASAGVRQGFFSRQQLLCALGERLQQAPLEVLLRYFRNQELQQQIKDAVDQVSDRTQSQQSAMSSRTNKEPILKHFKDSFRLNLYSTFGNGSSKNLVCYGLRLDRREWRNIYTCRDESARRSSLCVKLYWHVHKTVTFRAPMLFFRLKMMNVICINKMYEFKKKKHFTF